MRPSQVMMFPNGNTSVFDAEGHQVPVAQRPWMEAWLMEAERNGVLMEGVKVLMPSGRTARPYKTSSGWNWRIEP